MQASDTQSHRIIRLEEWRSREERDRIEDRKRIRALELSVAKVAGGAIVGSTLGGAIVALLSKGVGT